jgi:hypothetical protein
VVEVGNTEVMNGSKAIPYDKRSVDVVAVVN